MGDLRRLACRGDIGTFSFSRASLTGLLARTTGTVGGGGDDDDVDEGIEEEDEGEGVSDILE